MLFSGMGLVPTAPGFFTKFISTIKVTNKITQIFLLNYFFWAMTVQSGGGFLADTLVKTQGGYTSIESLSVGDLVLTPSNSEAGVCEQLVSSVQTKSATEAVLLQLGTEELWVASDQPFYVASEWRFVLAKDLTIGCVLGADSTGIVSVDNKSLVPGAFLFYSIALEKVPHFFISRRDILVHNNQAVFQAGDAVVFEMRQVLMSGGAVAAEAIVTVNAVSVGGVVAIIGFAAVVYYYREPIGQFSSSVVQQISDYFVSPNKGVEGPPPNYMFSNMVSIAGFYGTAICPEQQNHSSAEKSLPSSGLPPFGQHNTHYTNIVSVTPPTSKYDWRGDYDVRTKTLSVGFGSKDMFQSHHNPFVAEAEARNESEFAYLQALGRYEADVTNCALWTGKPIPMGENHVRMHRQTEQQPGGFFYDFDFTKQKFTFYKIKPEDGNQISLEKMPDQEVSRIIASGGPRLSIFPEVVNEPNHTFLLGAGGSWHSVYHNDGKFGTRYRVLFRGDSFVKDGLLWTLIGNAADPLRLSDDEGNYRGYAGRSFSGNGYHIVCSQPAPNPLGPYIQKQCEVKVDENGNFWKRFVFVNARGRAAVSNWGVFDANEILIAEFDKYGNQLSLGQTEAFLTEVRLHDTRLICSRDGDGLPPGGSPPGDGGGPPDPKKPSFWQKIRELLETSYTGMIETTEKLKDRVTWAADRVGVTGAVRSVVTKIVQYCSLVLEKIEALRKKHGTAKFVFGSVASLIGVYKSPGVVDEVVKEIKPMCLGLGAKLDDFIQTTKKQFALFNDRKALEEQNAALLQQLIAKDQQLVEDRSVFNQQLAARDQQLVEDRSLFNQQLSAKDQQLAAKDQQLNEDRVLLKELNDTFQKELVQCRQDCEKEKFKLAAILISSEKAHRAAMKNAEQQLEQAVIHRDQLLLKASRKRGAVLCQEALKAADGIICEKQHCLREISEKRQLLCLDIANRKIAIEARYNDRANTQQAFFLEAQSHLYGARALLDEKNEELAVFAEFVKEVGDFCPGV